MGLARRREEATGVTFIHSFIIFVIVFHKYLLSHSGVGGMVRNGDQVNTVPAFVDSDVVKTRP